jgi:hypothetical protein
VGRVAQNPALLGHHPPQLYGTGEHRAGPADCRLVRRRGDRAGDGEGLLKPRAGWQPSRFLTDRAKAERALALAERLGSMNAAATELGTWPSLRKAFTRHPGCPGGQLLLG